MCFLGNDNFIDDVLLHHVRFLRFSNNVMIETENMNLSSFLYNMFRLDNDGK